MPRLLLISAGQLTGYILERLARDGFFDDIVLAGRSPESARRKINNARIGAAIEGRFPAIRFAELDVAAADAGRRLAAIRPDVAVAAPSMLAWWRLDKASPIVARMPFGDWIAFHLAPMLAVRRAWVDSGLECPWVGASYPDVVNAVLHRTGAGPTCGVGNVAEVVPKVRFEVGGELGLDPGRVEVSLVAQHALEYFVYNDAQAPDSPPFMLKAVAAGRDVSELARKTLLRPFPIPYELDFNMLTASAAAVLLPALAGGPPVRTHVPAPGGLIGGYPVMVEGGVTRLDLPPPWTLEEAIACNTDSLAWEGIRAIDDDGTVRFTDHAAEALGELSGRRIESLAPDEAASVAGELLAKL